MLFSASLAVENVSYWIFFSDVPLKRICMSGFDDFFRHCLIVIWQRVNLELISRSSTPNFFSRVVKFQLFRQQGCLTICGNSCDIINRDYV